MYRGQIHDNSDYACGVIRNRIQTRTNPIGPLGGLDKRFALI